MHADSGLGPAPTDRGPAMHHDPADTPWDDLPGDMAPKTVKMSEALAEFDKWNSAKIRSFINEAVRAGLLPKDADYFQAKALWQDLVQEAVDKTAAGKPMSPWDVMSFIGGDADLAGAEEEGPFTGTLKHKSVRTDLTDPESARALIHDVLSGTLGRRATQEELDDFVTTIASYERANPEVTITKSRYKDGREVSSRSTTSGGGNPAQVVREAVEETPEYASYQAAGIYFPLLEQLTGGVEVGL
jgi:hypothetical protein